MAATCSGDWRIWMSFDERQCQALPANGRRYPSVTSGGISYLRAYYSVLRQGSPQLSDLKEISSKGMPVSKPATKGRRTEFFAGKQQDWVGRPDMGCKGEAGSGRKVPEMARRRGMEIRWWFVGKKAVFLPVYIQNKETVRGSMCRTLQEEIGGNKEATSGSSTPSTPPATKARDKLLYGVLR
ncbi:hypothetical protein DFH08DRAFT_807009 [Mycena albidolilacea]|uniref:Uncharacterized protein n=1 Tax=Mycena albidolilacea TaxID=1033008 RepID=A0AAD7A500_9AGAR|nr:hypothetical protein DFH08DRAFT_807009 [Mycena albidolilacea]